MDLTTQKYYHQPSPYMSSSQVESKSREKPFTEDPICKLNLKETSDFVKSLPMSGLNGSQTAHRKSSDNKKLMEAPSTPGRPIFSFSVSRKSVPSKWDDAEKWLINHNHNHIHDYNNNHDYGVIKKSEISRSSTSKTVISDKSRVIEEEKVPKLINYCTSDNNQHQLQQQMSSGAITFNGVIIPADMPLKDKFTDEIGPLITNFTHLEPTKEAFWFKSHQLNHNEAMTDACTEMIPIEDVKHRDIGTDMTPLGSSTTSRCNTPFKSISPIRHNTPATRSGLLTLTGEPANPINMAQLQECHLAKLHNGSAQFDSVTTNWSSREEEEEEISKSLRHFEFGRRSVSVSESKACAWEDEEKSKFCLRYQREEAKIQAWINLQNAKAEAQSRKLEVKIQKMRSNLEEKLMRRMAIVHKKAEEWRAAAQNEHSDQIRKAGERAQKLVLNNHHHHHQHHQNSLLHPHIVSCGCFPCNSK